MIVLYFYCLPYGEHINYEPFQAFSIFRGLCNTARSEPIASVVAIWTMNCFAPFKLYNIRQRGSVKTYQPPNSILFPDENNLARAIIFLHFHQSQIVIRFP